MNQNQKQYGWVLAIIVSLLVGVGFLALGQNDVKSTISPTPKATSEIVDVDTFEQTFGSAVDDYVAVPLEGWGSLWRTKEEYDGNDMPDDALIEAINIDLGVKHSIAPRLGSVVLGIATTVQSSVNSLFTASSEDGRELLVRTQSTQVEWWNGVDSNWDVLATSSASGAVHTFTQGQAGQEPVMYVYYADGTNGIRRFPVGFGTIASNTSTAIVLNSVMGYTTAAAQGFDASGGAVTVDGNDYRYTDLNSLTLQGMSGVPTFGANEGVIMADTGDGFTLAPSSTDALLAKDQRLLAAYGSNVHISKIDNFRDFSFSAPRVGSEGEIVSYPGGGDVTALADRGDYIAVFKKNGVFSLKFTDFDNSLFDVPEPNTVVTGIDVGAINQKGVTQRDFAVIYTTNDVGVTELGRAEGSTFDQPNYIAERVRPTAEDWSFSDTAAGIFRQYAVSSYRHDTTVTFNDRVLLYDFRSNRLSEQRGWNAASWAVYDNKLYFGDSLTKNVRQAFYDSYNDDGNPYTTKAKTKWYNFGAPANWKEIGWVFVEGWITPNTDITFRINLDEGGNLSQKTVTIDGSGNYVASNPPAGTFGLNPFGLLSFSVVPASDSNLRHFAGWIQTTDIFNKKFRNLQFEMQTTAVDSNYRITRIVPYVKVLDVNYSRQNNSNFMIRP